MFYLIKFSLSVVREKAKLLQQQFPENLGSSFSNECINFRGHLYEKMKNYSSMTVIDLYKFLKDFNISSVYPLVEISLRMYLSYSVSNCSAEHSFSSLKRIKSYLRSNMDDDRLNSLAILNIESEITKFLKYKKIIEDFANRKIF